MLPETQIALLRAFKFELDIHANRVLNLDQLHAAATPLLDMTSLISTRAVRLQNATTRERANPGDNTARSELTTAVGQLENTRLIVLTYLEEQYGDSEDSGLFFRLPRSALGTPDTMSKSLGGFLDSLDKLCRRIAGEGLQIVGVRHGTNWLALGATANVLMLVVHILRLYYERRDAAARIEQSNDEGKSKLQEAFDTIHREQCRRIALEHAAEKHLKEVDESVSFMFKLLDAYHAECQDGALLMLAPSVDDAVKRNLPVEAGGVGAAVLPDARRVEIAAAGSDDTGSGDTGIDAPDQESGPAGGTDR